MLFLGIFKEEYARLPLAWQKFHRVFGVHYYKGAARVERGSGPFVGMLADILGLPESSDVELHMRLDADGDGERWQRRFGIHGFTTRLSPARGEARYCLYESYGPFRFCVELTWLEGAVNWHLKKWWFAGIPLPRFTVPLSRTREFTDEKGRYCFEIEVDLIGLGRLIAYKGWLVADETRASSNALETVNKML